MDLQPGSGMEEPWAKVAREGLLWRFAAHAWFVVTFGGLTSRASLVSGVNCHSLIMYSLSVVTQLH